MVMRPRSLFNPSVIEMTNGAKNITYTCENFLFSATIVIDSNDGSGMKYAIKIKLVFSTLTDQD